MFDSRAAWDEAVAGFHRQIAVAVPIVERHRMPLGIENHKDWRVDDQVALLKQYSSEYVGRHARYRQQPVGPRRPEETVEKLAPYTFNTHFKDMAVEETADRVPDVGGAARRGHAGLDANGRRPSAAARPEVTFSLEMITRDPLLVPCLTDKYWSTFTDVNGRLLARALTRIRASRPGAPLPRISGLSEEQRYALELDLVNRSISYATAFLGL